MGVPTGGLRLTDAGLAVADADGDVLADGAGELGEAAVFLGDDEVAVHLLVLFVGLQALRGPSRGSGRVVRGSWSRGDAVVDGFAQLPAAGSSGGFDVVEAVALVGVGFIDRCAYEGVVVVDPDLGQVPGVVTDGDGAPDERGERGREVALTLEVDPVALDGAMLGDPQE